MPKPEVQGPRIIAIGGRQWRRVDLSTMDHDRYMVRTAERSGISIETRKHETPAQFGARLLDEIMDGGAAYDLLGGLLLPVEVQDNDWTRDHAKATAEFMRKLTDPDSKEIVLNLIVGMLIGFFEGARDSLQRSADASPSTEREDARVEETAPVS